jgi:hypothetical protein
MGILDCGFIHEIAPLLSFESLFSILLFSFVGDEDNDRLYRFKFDPFNCLSGADELKLCWAS